MAKAAAKKPSKKQVNDTARAKTKAKASANLAEIKKRKLSTATGLLEKQDIEDLVSPNKARREGCASTDPDEEVLQCVRRAIRDNPLFVGWGPERTQLYLVDGYNMYAEDSLISGHIYICKCIYIYIYIIYTHTSIVSGSYRPAGRLLRIY